ncbi:MAG TPA: PKD domain-containing protein [Flavilitoribacter sp.]|nr:PKD domain-containing protein [Flavilitoribacter sp.]HMQ88165.1 PKD domain-containing protein [Flavilitoribacter sp.]
MYTRPVSLPALLLLFYLSGPAALAQPKHDNVWILGYDPNIEQDSLGGTIIDFSEGVANASFFEIPLDMNLTASISDSAGQLLFYTNGCSIVNRNHELMLNGESINEGYFWDGYCGEGLYYPSTEGALVLPAPGSDSLYYLFHYWINDDSIFYGAQLRYSLIDFRLDNGLGGVVEKNTVLLTGDLQDQIEAVRHANGRDWWVILPEYTSNRYFVFLLTPEGVSGPVTQTVEVGWTNFSYIGQALFSPDGSKYIRVNPLNGAHIFDFDRCTGLLSNQMVIHFPEDTLNINLATGASVSPNGRFLYISLRVKVLQYDLTADNIAASRRQVAYYDGFQSPFATTFFQHCLAPDQQIYITASNSVNRLHVIHRPNLPGPACDLEQHGFRLNTLHAWHAPNFASYTLGPVDGSACDTLGVDNYPPLAAFEYLTDDLHAAFYHGARYNPDSWYWTFGDGAASTAIFPEHTYSAPGEYEVCLTVSNVSGSDTFCDTISITITGLDGPEENPGVRLYPNPARESVVLEVEEKAAFRGTIVLYDAPGRQVLRQAVRSSRERISISALPPGLYFYELRDGRRRVAGGKLVRL